MSTFTLVTSKNNTSNENSVTQLKLAVQSIAAMVAADVSEASAFDKYEQSLLKISNEVARQVLLEKLEETSRNYETEYLLVDDVRYKRHTKGTVDYHGLCGTVKVSSYTYRYRSRRRS